MGVEKITFSSKNEFSFNLDENFKISNEYILSNIDVKKFLIANNFKLALKLGLDGVYLPSFNKKFNHLAYSTGTNFIILGSAHNLKEIRIKELQNVQEIFISSLFKKNKNYLGLNKFKILKRYTKRNVVALGGISKKNIKKINLVNVLSFAGISYFE